MLTQAITLGTLLNYSIPSNWSTIARNITVLAAPSGITLEYDGFNATTSVKQADVVLLTYPLDYPQSDTVALSNLDFYAQATSANGTPLSFHQCVTGRPDDCKHSGPGMTYSIFSIDASALSTVGCAAYTYLLAASQPYSRAPFYQCVQSLSSCHLYQRLTVPRVAGFRSRRRMFTPSMAAPIPPLPF